MGSVPSKSFPPERTRAATPTTRTWERPLPSSFAEEEEASSDAPQGGMEARIRSNSAATGMNHHHDPHQASSSTSFSSTTPTSTWPCSNCHCQVEGDQLRCSNCHGIQVKVIIEDSSSRLFHPPNNNLSTPPHNLTLGAQPADACYLERLAASPAALLTPTTATTVRWVREEEEKEEEEEEERCVGPRTPTPPATVPVEREKVDDDYEYNDHNGEYDEEEDDDDDEDEATLEASPGQSFDVVYLDDVDFLRPGNPVAAILASVPSPVPAALKLDWSSEPYSGIGDILIHHNNTNNYNTGSDLGSGIESKRRATASFAAASVNGLAAAASSTEATTTGTVTGSTAWWPPKKQQRVL